MTKIKCLLITVILANHGCASSISPESYSVGSVGQINRTVSATIINAREVDIDGSTVAGGSIGAGAGAVAGSILGGNNIRGNLAGAIGGAVVGGIAGAVIEASATKQKGMEYIAETENGNLMTVVQGVGPIFSLGQKVFVLYGSPARIIPDRR